MAAASCRKFRHTRHARARARAPLRTLLAALQKKKKKGSGGVRSSIRIASALARTRVDRRDRTRGGCAFHPRSRRARKIHQKKIKNVFLGKDEQKKRHHSLRAGSAGGRPAAPRRRRRRAPRDGSPGGGRHHGDAQIKIKIPIASKTKRIDRSECVENPWLPPTHPTQTQPVPVPTARAASALREQRAAPRETRRPHGFVFRVRVTEEEKLAREGIISISSAVVAAARALFDLPFLLSFFLFFLADPDPAGPRARPVADGGQNQSTEVKINRLPARRWLRAPPARENFTAPLAAGGRAGGRGAGGRGAAAAPHPRGAAGRPQDARGRPAPRPAGRARRRRAAGGGRARARSGQLSTSHRRHLLSCHAGRARSTSSGTGSGTGRGLGAM